jgi:hypothetical protein
MPDGLRLRMEESSGEGCSKSITRLAPDDQVGLTPGPSRPSDGSVCSVRRPGQDRPLGRGATHHLAATILRPPM